MKVKSKKEVSLKRLGILVPYKTSIKLEALKIAKKIEMEEFTCEQCRTRFLRRRNQNKKKHNFCSRECYREYRRTQKILRLRAISKLTKEIENQNCQWCGRKLIFREKRRYCRSECGRSFKQVEQRIINTFEKPQIEVRRLQKLGCSYTFPEPYENFNGFYNLPQERVD